MAKFTKKNDLSKKELDLLLINFCNVLCQIKEPEEAAQFITDLLSKSEAQMLAKRLKIAEYLIAGDTYEQIKKDLKVSMGTIARVNEWLKLSGEGYRLMVGRSRGKDLDPIKPRWQGIKRKYPLYYWPEILLKEIVYSANIKQREKLRTVLNQLDEKTQLHKELNQLLLAQHRHQENKKFS